MANYHFTIAGLEIGEASMLFLSNQLEQPGRGIAYRDRERQESRSSPQGWVHGVSREEIPTAAEIAGVR